MGGLDSKLKYKVTPAKTKPSKKVSFEETNGKLKHLDTSVIIQKKDKNEKEKPIKFLNSHAISQEKLPSKEKKEEWSYTGVCSPNKWQNHYPLASGKHQSPINILTKISKYDEILIQYLLRESYDLHCCDELVNNGHTFQINCHHGADNSLFGGPLKNQYSLLQFHAHWGCSNSEGSEHLVDNKSYAAELHFVHWNSEIYNDPKEAMNSNKHDGLAVLAVFIKIGSKNHTLQKIINKFGFIKLKGQKYKFDYIADIIDVKQLLPRDTVHYWTYQGSLTTPPCTESVQWIVFKEPIEISEDQIESFRNLYICKNRIECCEHTKMSKNFRPVCQLNDRAIKEVDLNIRDDIFISF